MMSSFFRENFSFGLRVVGLKRRIKLNDGVEKDEGENKTKTSFNGEKNKIKGGVSRRVKGTERKTSLISTEMVERRGKVELPTRRS